MAVLGQRAVGFLDEQPSVAAEFRRGEAATEAARAELLVMLVVADELGGLLVDVVEGRLEDGTRAAGQATRCANGIVG